MEYLTLKDSFFAVGHDLARWTPGKEGHCHSYLKSFHPKSPTSCPTLHAPGSRRYLEIERSAVSSSFLRRGSLMVLSLETWTKIIHSNFERQVENEALSGLWEDWL